MKPLADNPAFHINTISSSNALQLIHLTANVCEKGTEYDPRTLLYVTHVGEQEEVLCS